MPNESKQDSKSISSRFMNLSARIDACEVDHEVFGEFADLLGDPDVSVYCRMEVCATTMRMHAECGFNTPEWLRIKMEMVLEHYDAIAKELKAKVNSARLAHTSTAR